MVRWLAWHYWQAPKAMLNGWANFLVFNFKYFSFARLLKTLFSHWRKYKDSYGRGFDIKVYARTFFLNIISRLLGFIARIFIMSIGLIIEVFILIAGIALILFWIILPFLIIAGLWSGVYLLI